MKVKLTRSLTEYEYSFLLDACLNYYTEILTYLYNSNVHMGNCYLSQLVTEIDNEIVLIIRFQYNDTELYAYCFASGKIEFEFSGEKYCIPKLKYSSAHKAFKKLGIRT